MTGPITGPQNHISMRRSTLQFRVLTTVIAGTSRNASPAAYTPIVDPLDDFVRIESNESADPHVRDPALGNHSTDLPDGYSKSLCHGFDVQQHRETARKVFSRNLDPRRPFFSIRTTLRR